MTHANNKKLILVTGGATKILRLKGATKNFIESSRTEILKYPCGDKIGSVAAKDKINSSHS